MGFLRKLLGLAKGDGSSGPPDRPPTSPPARGPDEPLIRGFDRYGRELAMTRDDWRASVLLPALRESRDDPDRLYGPLVTALRDGMAADVIEDAEHLRRTDPDPERGATLLGVTYLEAGRLDDAERVLTEHVAAHGETGVVLTNLAKVHFRRGDAARAEDVLWHALELDPNQDDAFAWYAAIQRERLGEAGLEPVWRRLAALPGSWRAKLWLARERLERGALAEALDLYGDVLDAAGGPTPADVLEQVSGDLASRGHLAEAVRLVHPRFDPRIHGPRVGNNLVHAHLQLGAVDAARAVVDGLHAQDRPDWRDWLTSLEAAVAGVARGEHPAAPDEAPTLAMFVIEGPLWATHGSPARSLVPAKPAGARRVAILGSTVLLADPGDRPGVRPSDAPGRLSRALPLLVAEGVHLGTDGLAAALIPYVQDRGFAVLGRAHDDDRLAALVRQGEEPADLAVGITLDATREPWRAEARVLRASDGARLGIAEVSVPLEEAGPAAERLARGVLEVLAAKGGLRAVDAPAWYRLPAPTTGHLLRLEQLLAVGMQGAPGAGSGGLYGSRQILDAALHACLDGPENALARLLLAQTLREMRRTKPELVRRVADRVGDLQREHPLAGAPGAAVEAALAEATAP